jgi:hypothetical protein
MTSDSVILVAILIVILIPLVWAGLARDRIQGDAARRVFKNWGRTWKRLGRDRERKN